MEKRSREREGERERERERERQTETETETERQRERETFPEDACCIYETTGIKRALTWKKPTSAHVQHAPSMLADAISARPMGSSTFLGSS